MENNYEVTTMEETVEKVEGTIEPTVYEDDGSNLGGLIALGVGAALTVGGLAVAAIKKHKDKKKDEPKKEKPKKKKYKWVRVEVEDDEDIVEMENLDEESEEE